MNLYDMVVSRGTRLVAPMLAPLGASLLGVDPVAARGARQVQLRALEALQERFSPDIVFPMMDLSAGWRPSARPPGGRLHAAAAYRRGKPSTRLEQLDEIADIDPEEHPSMLFQLDLAAEMRSNLDAPVAAFASGPFHLAGQLFGAEEMLLWAASGEECLGRHHGVRHPPAGRLHGGPGAAGGPGDAGGAAVVHACALIF